MAVSDCIRHCKRCGVEFRRTGKGQPTKYCGAKCRDEAISIRSAARVQVPRIQGVCSVPGCGGMARARMLCPKHYCRMRAHGDPEYRPTRKVEKPCEWCAAVMVLPKGVAAKQKYCSRACVGKAQSMRVAGLAACRVCAAEFVPYANAKCSEGKKVYCSALCREAVRRESGALSRIARNWAKPVPQSPAVLSEIAALRRIARYVERPALFRVTCSCGVVFIARRNGGLHQKVCQSCSAERKAVARRVAKARRRAIERHASADRIDPIEVFKRDRWKCQLCRRSTPQVLRGTYDPRAPELDHVVPLAVGGAHVWSNVQCACRQCNIAKGARPAGQLSLAIAS